MAKEQMTKATAKTAGEVLKKHCYIYNEKPNEVTLWHTSKSGQWHKFRVHAMGVDYEVQKHADIPENAIAVSHSYYDEQTKEIRDALLAFKNFSNEVIEVTKKA